MKRPLRFRVGAVEDMAHGCAAVSPAVGPAQEAGQGRADAHPADPLFLDQERQELPLAVTGGTIQHRDRSGSTMKTHNPPVRIMYIMFNYDGLGTWSPCGLAHDCCPPTADLYPFLHKSVSFSAVTMYPILQDLSYQPASWGC